jgi:MFS family permease
LSCLPCRACRMSWAAARPWRSWCSPPSWRAAVWASSCSANLARELTSAAFWSASLIAYALVSLACALAPSLPALVGLRFLHGLSGAAAAVFAPGMIRAMFSEAGAVRALRPDGQRRIPRAGARPRERRLAAGGRSAGPVPSIVMAGLSLIVAVLVRAARQSVAAGAAIRRAARAAISASLISNSVYPALRPQPGLHAGRPADLRVRRPRHDDQGAGPQPQCVHHHAGDRHRLLHPRRRTSPGGWRHVRAGTDDPSFGSASLGASGLMGWSIYGLRIGGTDPLVSSPLCSCR